MIDAFGLVLAVAGLVLAFERPRTWIVHAVARWSQSAERLAASVGITAPQLGMIRVLAEPNIGVVSLGYVAYRLSTSEDKARVDAEALEASGWCHYVTDEFGMMLELFMLREQRDRAARAGLLG